MYSEVMTYTYDVISTLHATNATSGGGKNAHDKDLLCEGRG
jgi:hypothetical protein